jgi:starch phosphorylase
VWTEACGKERWRLPPDSISADIHALSDADLWEMRALSRSGLVTNVRATLKRQLAERGFDQNRVEIADRVLDPNILTLGFARRFTGYKRSDLLLRDIERFGRLLNHPACPAQLIIAGKAHPEDREGKEMIREWVMLAQRPEFRSRVVFLEDYDLTLAQELAQGVDVWINTPRRPWEACGTSGMKVLVNGGLNLSELDGWWEEAYAPDNGWAIGDLAPALAPDIDKIEADELYELIEQAIAPEFYDRDRIGLPLRWLARVRQSMASLTPRYSSNRTVREYLERAYLPAAKHYGVRTTDRYAAAKAVECWAQRLKRGWANLHVAEPSVTIENGRRTVSAAIYFGEIEQADVAVELYSDAGNDGRPTVLPMRKGDALPGATNGSIYSVRLRSDLPIDAFTVRIVPAYHGVELPAELPLIAWQR